jgi:hypothetical protein
MEWFLLVAVQALSTQQLVAQVAVRQLLLAQPQQFLIRALLLLPLMVLVMRPGAVRLLSVVLEFHQVAVRESQLRQERKLPSLAVVDLSVVVVEQQELLVLAQVVLVELATYTQEELAQLALEYFSAVAVVAVDTQALALTALALTVAMAVQVVAVEAALPH